MDYYDELHEKAIELIKKWEKFDFNSLEHWQPNPEFASFMRATENVESDSLCLIYSIVEARMCAYMGRIAVVKGQDDSKLVFTSKDPSYVEICVPNYSEDGQYVFIQVYTNEFVGALIIDVINSRFAGIKYPIFEFCTITPLDGDEVEFTNFADSKKSNTSERIHLSSINWHLIDNPVVDYIPFFELYWL